jgi:PKD repeat protein
VSASAGASTMMVRMANDGGSRRGARRTFGAVVIVVLAVALGLAGCSSDGAATDTSSTTGSPTTAAAPLVASFEIDVDLDTTRPTSCPLRSITFTDTSQGQPMEWAWAFPDGSTSDERSPVVTPDAGESSDWNGEVTLTVTRGDETNTASDEIELPTC